MTQGKNVIQYLISEKGFEIVEGRSDCAFSYSEISRTIIKKDNIRVVVGLAGDLHFALSISKNDRLAFYQDAMQITNKIISEAIDRISRADYSYIEKSVRKVLVSDSEGRHGITPFIDKEYDFFMLKDLGL